ncbi:MAG: hypothetical protein Ct9H300mP1_20010 [Planctomycetaceae bacterium]|nr:MAG: hypothetical protein Ct9H300mP1_20010 [Planctomycetaceae bacterium]
MAISDEEHVSLMINEEDHLRIPVLQSGLSLDSCWDPIQQIDNQLDETLTFAFNERLGYLTACPTNVGTGIRVSVMLHLPALVLTKEINKAFNACTRSISRPWTLRGGQPGHGRLLPDLQPDHARQKRTQLIEGSRT